MTKKDYIKFAKMFKERLEFIRNDFDEKNGDDRVIYLGRQVELKTIARQVAGLFAEDNPNFDRSRFLIACGLEEK